MHPRLPGSLRSGHLGPVPGRARPRSLSRRQLLAGAGTLGLGASLLAGCGEGGGGGGGRSGAVTVWDLFSGADGANMRGMIADVEATIDGLNVDVTTLAWGNPYYTKLAMASSSQAPPDTAIMHASRMPGFAPGGLLQPWDRERLSAPDRQVLRLRGPGRRPVSEPAPGGCDPVVCHNCLSVHRHRGPVPVL